MNSLKVLIVFLILAAVKPLQAGVVIGGTRLVYDASKKESSISVNNPEKKRPYLIQSWVENYSENNDAKTPFVITPPLFRLDPGQENVIRLIEIGKNLPKDRESVYWLNIKSIPSSQKSTENTLLISVKTRIKLFYRPDGLVGTPEEAYDKVTFSKSNGNLNIKNGSPYHISINKLEANGHKIDEVDMLMPNSEKSFKLPVGNETSIKWSAINDYGGLTQTKEAKI